MDIKPVLKTSFPYILTTPATTYPIDLCLVKSHLKIPEQSTSDDAYLTLLIQAVTNYAEKYTRRDFLNKTYTTYRDYFTQIQQLKKATVSSITSIQYLVDGVFTTLSTSIYALEVTNDFPIIYLKKDQEWVSGVDNVPQAIKIVFVAGYGSTADAVPSEVKMGLLNHVAFLYENRGDCGCDDASALQSGAKALYDSVKIIDLAGQDYLANQDRGYGIMY